METSSVRINIGGDKKDALLTARKVRQLLEQQGTTILRGEYVRLDGRIYLDASNTTLPTPDQLAGVSRGTASVELEPLGTHESVEECLNCGNVPDAPFTTCPNCGFREISSCPSCSSEIPRTKYAPAGGNLFQCPTCRTRVRLAYNEPLWRDDSRYTEPVIIVTLASSAKL